MVMTGGDYVGNDTGADEGRDDDSAVFRFFCFAALPCP